MPFRGENPHKAFRAAVERWKGTQFPSLMREARRNLTGRMFHRRTGRTLSNVQAKSRLLKNGFRLATSLPSLMAWMQGSPRRSYWVAPVRARALRWIDKRTGQVRFSRGHRIPPWRFTPKRPALEDAQLRRQRRIIEAMEREGIAAMKTIFVDRRIKHRIKV